jgi:hypothetical protein
LHSLSGEVVMLSEGLPGFDGGQILTFGNGIAIAKNGLISDQ